MSNHPQAQIFDFRDKTSRTNLLAWRKALTGKLVFTNGVFDILHHGHVDYLAKAAAHGDALIIGMNSDDSVRRLKGEHRPIQAEADRAAILAALKVVDAVTYFEENTPLELITFLIPDILIKGADYKIEDIAGSDVVLSHGGKVLTIDLVEGRSTSSAIETIVKRYGG